MTTTEERVRTLSAWRLSTDLLNADLVDANDMPVELRARFREMFRDIPTRDAIIAEIASQPENAKAYEALLQAISEDGDVPTDTLIAAMHYMDGHYDTAEMRVFDILEREDYSLARLLSTGLMMGATGDFLRQSLSFYEPEALIAG